MQNHAHGITSTQVGNGDQTKGVTHSGGTSYYTGNANGRTGTITRGKRKGVKYIIKVL